MPFDHADEHRISVHAGELIQDAYSVISSAGWLDFDGQRGLGELFGDGGDRRNLRVRGLLEREIKRPHTVGNYTRSRTPGTVEARTQARLRSETRTRRPSSRHWR